MSKGLLTRRSIFGALSAVGLLPLTKGQDSDMGFDGNSGFAQPISGANGELIVPQIQSPNFQPGVQGWRLGQDGTLQASGADITGPVIIDGQNLYYSGTPATGTLFMSIAEAGGFDTYGNQYFAGISLYGNFGGASVQIATIGLDGTGAPQISATALGTSTSATLSTDWNNGVAAVLTLGNAHLVFDPSSGKVFTTMALYAELPGGSSAETWHTLAPAAGWTNSATMPMSKKLFPDRTAAIEGSMAYSGTPASGQLMATLTTAYTPVQDKFYLCPAANDVFLVHIVGTANGANAGQISVQNWQGNTLPANVSIYVSFRYPLDL